MAVLTRPQVATKISTFLADNDTGAITAAQLRSVFTDVVDSSAFGTEILTENDIPKVVSGDANNLIIEGTDGGAYLDTVAAGADGLSAYEIAVLEGFVGNQSAWIESLTGPQGAAEDLSDYATKEISINVVVEDYTIQLTDRGKILEIDSANTVTVTIPTNAAIALPVGTIFNIIKIGEGETIITASANVALNGVGAGSTEIETQFSAVSIYKRAADEWVMNGSHSLII